jgi:signal transduction histidine kinase
LRGGNLDVDSEREALETIDRNAEIQARLVDDLVDVSRMTHGKLRLERGPVSLDSLARHAAQSAQPDAARKSVTLGVSVEPGADLTTIGDGVRLLQVFGNLLSNAIRYTPPGGTVEIKLERHGGAARIEVCDTGAGIDAQDLPYVFDRFWQADPSPARAHHGLGLGLTIVRQLVELHGGTVVAHSDGPGRGARFEILLPLVAVETLTTSQAST